MICVKSEEFSYDDIVPSAKVKLVANMLKAIHARESLAAAG
jgi:hypothetical protein